MNIEYIMQLGIRMDYEERNERALYRHNHIEHV